MSTEPSQWAKAAQERITDCVLTDAREEDEIAQRIQEAIGQALDAAVMAADKRIAELEARLRFYDEVVTGIVTMQKLRIAEMEAQVAFAAKVDTALMRKMDAMAALLDRVPHWRDSWDKCIDDCPACAWAKMKESKKQ